MPIIRLKEIAAMSTEDRANKLYDLRAELARIQTMINAGGRVDNASRVRELRKTIAQILTIQNEEKLGIRKAPAQPEKKEKPAKKAANKEEAKEQTLQ
jgi:large subunit ribosomal protein L29